MNIDHLPPINPKVVLRPEIFNDVPRVGSAFTTVGERTPENPLGYNMTIVPANVKAGMELVLANGGDIGATSLDEAVAREVYAAGVRRERLAKFMGIEAAMRNVACPVPEHGNKMVEVGPNTIGNLRFDAPDRPKADAAVILEPGFGNMYASADCVVLDIVDPNRDGVVAQAHGGWQGEVNGIFQNTMRDLTQNYGLVAKNALVNIHPAATEGFELKGRGLDNWIKAGFGEFVKTSEVEVEGELVAKTYIDMTAAAIAKLEEAGVRRDRIQTSGAYAKDGKDLNTLTSPQFYSHRTKDDKGFTGRNAALLVRVDY